MIFGENSNVNPFAQMTKNRIHMRNNPFELGKRDFQELTLNNTLKSKPRPSQYPKLEINPFIKEDKEDKAPFKKGEQDYNSIFKPPHNCNSRPIFENLINTEKEEKKEKQEKKIIYRPNINIFICDSKSLTSNNPFLINAVHRMKMQKRLQAQDELRYENNKRKDKDDEMFDLIVDINNNYNKAAPSPVDPVEDCLNLFQNLNINSQQSQKKEKDDSPKMFTNDGSNDLGESYIE